MPREFGRFNAGDPAWLIRMASQPPRCYTEQQWVDYLRAVQIESQDNDALRSSLCRGNRPDYCFGCTERHQRRMHKAARCEPPVGAQSPLTLLELQDLHSEVRG